MTNLPTLNRNPATNPGGTNFVCDLSYAKAFFPFANEPPVSIIAAFGQGDLHQCRLEGSWDFERAVSENRTALVRSYRQLIPKPRSDFWDDVIFQFAPKKFLCGEKSRIVGYGGTAEEAENIVREFTLAYGTKPPQTGGQFHLIRKEHNDFRCESVTLGLETVLADEDVALRYRDDAVAWHRAFVEKLTVRQSGLSILEGTPGTGKTTYLRHLMGTLQNSHRFYFIPPSHLKLVAQPELIGFWAAQKRAHSDRHLTVILEDADEALLARGVDNRELVSALLNLSDGMLGDLLGLQIICTTNCSATEIDGALMRPGRLVTHRVFSRLNRSEACRLASTLGRVLPDSESYSLAEVFSGNSTETCARPRIGFAP